MEDIDASVKFFENAFGLKNKLIFENRLVEMETGETILSFAKYLLIKQSASLEYSCVKELGKSAGMEIGFTVSSVQEAVSCGATPLTLYKHNGDKLFLT